MNTDMSTPCYTAYGHASPTRRSHTGFNGECVLKPLEYYALGAGHRLYSPSLMRFLSADLLSPFEKGGLNAYAYCAGDPVNRIDPTGQSWYSLFKGIANRLGWRTPSKNRPPTYDQARNQLPRSTRQQIEETESKINYYKNRLVLSNSSSNRSRYASIIEQLTRSRDNLWNHDPNVPPTLSPGRRRPLTQSLSLPDRLDPPPTYKALKRQGLINRSATLSSESQSLRSRP